MELEEREKIDYFTFTYSPPTAAARAELVTLMRLAEASESAATTSRTTAEAISGQEKRG